MPKNQILFHPKDTKQHTTDKDNPQKTQQLQENIKKIKKPIFKIQATFPFDPFPDQIVVDEERVSIILKDIFGTERVDSILVPNITDVEVNTGPIFSELVLIDKNIPNKPFGVNYLKKDEAFKMRRIIQGLMIAKQRNMDLSSLSQDEMVKMMEELGSVV